MSSRKRPTMKDALKSSIASEEKALDLRFERAENVLALREAKKIESSGSRGEKKETKEKPRPAPSRPTVVRRTFSLTQTEYDLVFELKRRCNLEGFEAAQSEIIRAGLHQLARLDGTELKRALGKIEKLRRGRATD